MSTPAKALLGLVVTGIGTAITLLVTNYLPSINDTISSGPPVDVVVQHDKPLTAAGQFAIPETLSGNPLRLKSLATEHPEAVPVGGFGLKLILEGRRSQPVVITELRAHVLTRSKPLAGTLITVPSQGLNTDVSGCMYLADTAPTLVAADPSGSVCEPAAPPFFTTHNLTLNRGEQAVINVQAMVSRSNPAPTVPTTGSYEWEFVLSVVQNGKTTDLTIRDGTQPFRLTSYAPGYQAVYSGNDVMTAVDPAQWLRLAFPDGPPR